MELNYYNILLAVIFFHCLLFSAFLLFSGKSKLLSNKVLAVFLIAEGLSMLDSIFWGAFQHFITSNPHVFHILTPFLFIKGPALFFYTKTMANRRFTFNRRHLIHLIPAGILTVYFFSGYVFNSADVKRELILGGLFPPPGVWLIIMGGVHASVLCYVIFSLRILGKFSSEVKNIVSSLEKANLRWLQFILYSFIAMWTCWVSSYLFRVFNGHYHPYLGIIGTTLLFIAANIIIFKGLMQQEIFIGYEDKPKYEGSPVSDPEKKKYIEKLTLYMISEKPYLEPSLTINELAENIAVVPRYLSQAINEQLGRNFYDFVNSYRISDAKRMLLESDATVLEILYEVGFNSKSAFNLAFKTHTGMTPTAFRKSVYLKVPA